ncbi:hypothetical protein H257_03312 [Aphanomyces astaci]|uniref:Uncharacterized protein n=1 Tax=Aphanomyces astaci TaxID=112090 RepID=W4H214_APHAT|nr:hypothetical protein H257_03312 [Aphanomyces astaci]ETV85606.1 hypothetical protein H257_03312 [Aphanomyces astaci]|eukprot:XP_009825624.1 hypothetical protein H257_03312 [Aphanomyces astaci]
MKKAALKKSGLLPESVECGRDVFNTGCALLSNEDLEKTMNLLAAQTAADFEMCDIFSAMESLGIDDDEGVFNRIVKCFPPGLPMQYAVGCPDGCDIKTLATVTMPYDSADTAPTVSTTPAEDVAHKALRTIIDSVELMAQHIPERGGRGTALVGTCAASASSYPRPTSPRQPARSRIRKTNGGVGSTHPTLLNWHGSPSATWRVPAKPPWLRRRVKRQTQKAARRLLQLEAASRRLLSERPRGIRVLALRDVGLHTWHLTMNGVKLAAASTAALQVV